MAKKSEALFARLSLDYMDHPKIIVLSNAAFRAHVAMILYARKFETDGIIPARMVHRIVLDIIDSEKTHWVTDSVTDSVKQHVDDVINELMTNDVNAPSLTRLSHDKYMLYGYSDMQETKAEIAERRAKNQRNGAKGGRPRGSKKTQWDTQSVIKNKTQWVSEKKPSGVPETETETDKLTPPHRGAPRRADGATAQTSDTNGATIRRDKTQGHALPETWEPSKDDVEAMRKQCPGVDLGWETQKFMDYWLSKPGKDGRKKHWGRTWRNWIRRAYETNTRTEPNNSRHMTTSERRRQEAVNLMEYARQKTLNPVDETRIWDTGTTGREITP